MRRLALLLGLLGCHKSGDGPMAIDALAVPPVFPADYAATYALERGCRSSSDHDLQMIKIYVDPTAAPAYEARDAPFPIGALIVKEQYDFGDPDCAGPIVQWTAARHDVESTDVATDHLGWTWQRVHPDRTVDTQDDTRCYGCHKDCTDPTMNGYRFMCSQPP